jgi:hypothetical protein
MASIANIMNIIILNFLKFSLFLFISINNLMKASISRKSDRIYIFNTLFFSFKTIKVLRI